MHPNSGTRRRHSDELKARVLAACDEPGASISGVALAHGLNTNLVRKWRSGRGVKRAVMAIAPTAAIQAPPAALGAAPQFVAVDMPAPLRAAARAAVWTYPNPTDTAGLHGCDVGGHLRTVDVLWRRVIQGACLWTKADGPFMGA